MSSPFDDVGLFHRLLVPEHGFFGDGSPPRLLPDDLWAYRRRFFDEELAEADAAHGAGDLAEFFDALIDVAWLAMGAAHHARLPFEAGWAEVRRANMAKERGPTGKPGRGHEADIRKPAGWRAPDHLPALVAAGFVLPPR